MCNPPFSSFEAGRRERCEKDILTAYLQNMKRISDGHDPLFSLFDMILGKGLISPGAQNYLKDSVKECEGSQKTSEECHNSVKNYVSQAMENSTGEIRQNLEVMIVSLFSADEKQQLIQKIAVNCPDKHMVSSRQYENCYYNELKVFYSDLESLGGEFKSFGFGNIFHHFQEKQQANLVGRWFSSLFSNPFRSERSINEKALKHIMKEPNDENIGGLIQKGIKKDNAHNPDVLSFTKSLCFFWFDFYFKNYLQKSR